ncbi:PASTA domain-containing protein [Kribbella catacumbae]|uniref:PASTA domain-containing protein n=1 Tax=Kribbella catacumbae TaxID=460086 RepID=UPI0003697AA3|nr:PASTA domain-containing protein [Kribbella catacumbae]
MNESKLTELLERAGERTSVGPPPIDAIRAGATRLRRRRTVAASVTAAAALVAMVGGTALVATHGRSLDNPPPPAASASPGPVPAATRLLGIGHAAIAVPKVWGTNQSSCGTPKKDTVLIDDPSAALLCQSSRPSGVESVELASGKPLRFDFHADETIEVDGVRAERQRTRCTDGAINNVRVCSGAVFIPSLDVSFRAESSTNAGEVDRILERIVIVPDRVGVPEPLEFIAPNNSPALSGEKYANRLTALGLKPRIQTRKAPGYSPGDVLAVSLSSAPGTMLPLGATVTITIDQP